MQVGAWGRIEQWYGTEYDKLKLVGELLSHPIFFFFSFPKLFLLFLLYLQLLHTLLIQLPRSKALSPADPAPWHLSPMGSPPPPQRSELPS